MEDRVETVIDDKGNQTEKIQTFDTYNPINGKGVNLSYVIDPTGGNYDQGLAQTYLTAAKESYNRDLGLPINTKVAFSA